MDLRFFNFLFLGALLFTLGCGQLAAQKVQKTIGANLNARTSLEWEQSENHPDILFAQWRRSYETDVSQRGHLTQEICQELGSLNGQELSIFESSLRDPGNVDLFAGCRDQLFLALEQYYLRERSRLAINKNNWVKIADVQQISFPPNVQRRDTTNGYFAVTGDVAKKEVILTFDDGPSGAYTDSILQTLKEVDAKALFFQLGKNIRSNPDLVRRVAADGHAIGSHSNTHLCLGSNIACFKMNGRTLSEAEAMAEIRSGHQAIFDVLGWVDPFFRFPYGESSQNLREALRTHSVGEFFWSIDSEDWKAQPVEVMLKRTLSQLEAKGRGMILFHDIQRKTVEALPQFLFEIYTRGYSIVLLQSSDANARYNSKLIKRPLP